MLLILKIFNNNLKSYFFFLNLKFFFILYFFANNSPFAFALSEITSFIFIGDIVFL